MLRKLVETRSHFKAFLKSCYSNLASLLLELLMYSGKLHFNNMSRSVHEMQNSSGVFTWNNRIDI